ncbi:OmpH family outer membrane protein [Nonlabens ponticola]|uniref:OmpH family outer membrane protein n=1 Tax=Nonlabens ponticola TaxID=2496866 RepID=A0A3S9N0L5_9FLAO|nr:OmpH family outer membrane protein [Nonlabens ponticola]AZQ44957.1 OmpH family outer membrane protein [Nonlabens ponticola]
MKKVLLLLFLVAGSAMAQTGYVQYEAILANMPEVEPIRKEITQLTQKLQADLQEMEAKSAAKMQELQYQAQKPNVTEAEQQNIQQQAAALQKEYVNSSKAAELQLGAKENDLMKPILEKLNKAIEEVAKAKGLKAVVDGKVLIYAEPGVNITKEVAMKLGIDTEGK